MKAPRVQNLNQYLLHKQLVLRYQAIVPTPQKSISEMDVLKRAHQFIREDDSSNDWEDRVAKKYYDKLFKEYCLGDFSRYKTGAVGLRWRTKKECIEGKGHFSCGNLDCDKVQDLSSWEMNFAYLEHGSKKNALVKIRLCPKCTYKLHYKKLKAERKAEKKRRSDDDPQLDPAEKKARVEAPTDSVTDNLEIPPSSTETETAKPENVWAVPITEKDLGNQKSKEEEMDEYLASLFM
ncbi:hypothetical protein HDV03_001289 [Kappamyces sp. JEL0829]|nr:hypothetical protein HDV03_001289 [Kappamyces sp. JEL0829]